MNIASIQLHLQKKLRQPMLDLLRSEERRKHLDLARARRIYSLQPKTDPKRIAGEQ